MKRLIAVMFILVLGMTGCGVKQEKYDEVMAANEKLQIQYDEVVKNNEQSKANYEILSKDYEAKVAEFDSYRDKMQPYEELSVAEAKKREKQKHL